MDKIKRHQLYLKGFKILRERSNNKGFWNIVAYTDNGGWSLISIGPLNKFATKELCSEAIKVIVERDPEVYLHDN
jgi:hypothetical protein